MGGLPASRATRPGLAQQLVRFSLLLGFLLCLPLLASGNTNIHQIVPFEMDSEDRLITELSFTNGARASAVIDTAATLPMIGGATARSAGVAVVEGEEQFVEVLGLGGPQMFPLIDLPSLGAGTVTLQRVPAALDRKIAVEACAMSSR